MIPRFFDIHAHVNDQAFDADRAQTLARMGEGGVYAIMVGTDRASSAQVVEMATGEQEGVYASIGIHPIDDPKEVFDADFFGDLVARGVGKVVAVGECGLDYSRLSEDTDIDKEKLRQKNLFEQQIEFAIGQDLPLMIHCRDSDKSLADAHRDVLAILRTKKDEGVGKLRGNVHFFSQTRAIAEEYIALGFTISFTGVITFAREYDEVIRGVPLESLLSETDCPYVAPLPYRGKRNESAYVVEVVKKIAELRGEEYEYVRQKLLENAFRVFRIQD